MALRAPSFWDDVVITERQKQLLEVERKFELAISGQQCALGITETASNDGSVYQSVHNKNKKNKLKQLIAYYYKR